jgi:heme exporter protein C
MLRGVVRENQQANLSAVFGIIGFINVPLTFFAIRLWRTIHPVIITPQGVNMVAPMKHTLILSFCAFSFLFFSLLISRINLEKTRMKIEGIRDWIENELAHGN